MLSDTTDPMRIAITTPSYPPDVGGVAQVALRQARFLADGGHTVAVFSAGLESHPTVLESNIKVFRLPIRYRGFPSYAAGDALGVPSVRNRDAYLDALVGFNPDVILSHCWQAWNTDWLITFGREFHSRLALFSHGVSVNSGHGIAGPLRRARWSQYKRTHLIPGLRSARKLIVLEDYSDDDRFLDAKTARQLGICLTAIPNGSNPYLTADFAENPIGKDKTALFVGQFTKDKGADTVMEAFVENTGTDWQLKMCGSTRTSLLNKLEAKKHPRVSFHVGLNTMELAPLYRESQLFLHASLSECQPLVLIDAMAAGVPFVSTKVGSVECFHGGVVVADRNQFGAAIRDLSHDAQKRTALSHDGKLQAREKYDWRRSLTLLEAELRGIVENRR